MRVVAGRWRGRRLTAPAGRAVRPTSDRAKEALFSILAPRLEGSVVADLCCGAGGLGIEALSRGAVLAHFVDRSGVALRAVRENLERLAAEPALYRLHRADCLRWLEGMAAAAGERPLIVVADPPYDSGLAGPLLALLAGSEPGRPLLAAVVESGSGGEPPPVPEAAGWRCRRRRHGAALLTILEV